MSKKSKIRGVKAATIIIDEVTSYDIIDEVTAFYKRAPHSAAVIKARKSSELKNKLRAFRKGKAADEVQWIEPQWIEPSMNAPWTPLMIGDWADAPQPTLHPCEADRWQALLKHLQEHPDALIPPAAWISEEEATWGIEQGYLLQSTLSPSGLAEGPRELVATLDRTIRKSEVTGKPPLKVRVPAHRPFVVTGRMTKKKR